MVKLKHVVIHYKLRQVYKNTTEAWLPGLTYFKGKGNPSVWVSKP